MINFSSVALAASLLQKVHAQPTEPDGFLYREKVLLEDSSNTIRNENDAADPNHFPNESARVSSGRSHLLSHQADVDRFGDLQLRQQGGGFQQFLSGYSNRDSQDQLQAGSSNNYRGQRRALARKGQHNPRIHGNKSRSSRGGGFNPLKGILDFFGNGRRNNNKSRRPADRYASSRSSNKKKGCVTTRYWICHRRALASKPHHKPRILGRTNKTPPPPPTPRPQRRNILNDVLNFFVGLGRGKRTRIEPRYRSRGRNSGRRQNHNTDTGRTDHRRLVERSSLQPTEQLPPNNISPSE